MAFSNYLSRIIYKEHTEDGFAGEYKLLLEAKSIPSPIQPKNAIETTTMEDAAQTFIEGIYQSGQKEYTGNLSKEYLDGIDELAGKKVDLIVLYGNTGTGDQAKYAYTGQVSATPSDTSGVDGVVEMTVTATPNTVPVKCTDTLTVTDKGNGNFTVAKVS